jgi:uncharacterized protein YecE (DUF72 family)
MHQIHLGTCGWSYPDWNGKFYPAGTKAADYLSAYSERHHVVEVDSTFYGIPRPKMVQGWRDRTPDKFGFSLKVPQVITHEKILQDCQADVAQFLDSARILGDKLTCCLLQFGYFNQNVFPDLDSFLTRLDPFLGEWPKDVPLAVEVRNKHWFTKRFAACLRSHKAAWALVDQAWVPSPRSVAEKLDVVTGPFGYVRLLGDRAEVDRLTPTLDHIVIDRSEQIQSDAEAIEMIAERVPVLAFINNHFAGYAPETLEELSRRLEALQDPF